MINTNYAEQVALARSSQATVVSFDNNPKTITSIPAEKDTVILSDHAVAMMNGKEHKEEAPTYVRPETARSLLAQNEAVEDTNDTLNEDKKVIDNRFSEIMQSILDQRIGVDRKKLEELDALMKKIAENENMSPEEKQQALEKLAEMREKVIQESREVLATTEQTEQTEQTD